MVLHILLKLRQMRRQMKCIQIQLRQRKLLLPRQQMLLSTTQHRRFRLQTAKLLVPVQLLLQEPPVLPTVLLRIHVL